MAVKDVFKVGFKTFFNPRSWMNYDGVKQDALSFFAIIKVVFKRPSAPVIHKETFEEAMQRLQLTDDEVYQTGQNYLFYSIFFLIASLFVLGFAFFLLKDGYLLGCFIAIAMSGVLLANAYRNNFWYFQIKHRKLGCTFQEWRTGKVTREDAE